MPKNVLVAGAAGFIGTRVCAELSKKGYSVYALVLPQCEISHIECYVKKFIHGDLRDHSIVDTLFNNALDNNIEYIISLVGSVDYHQDYETSSEINFKTTKNITTAAKKLHEKNKLKRYLYIGSVASRGFLKKRPSVKSGITEDKDCYKKGISVYCDIKRECENYINEIIESDSLDAVIVEPGSLIGEEIANTTTTNVGLIKKIVKGFPVLGGGASYTSVGRVAEGIVLAMDKGRKGETYLLGGENMSMKEFAELVRLIMSKEFPQANKPAMPILTIPKVISYIIGKMN